MVGSIPHIKSAVNFVIDAVCVCYCHFQILIFALFSKDLLATLYGDRNLATNIHFSLFCSIPLAFLVSARAVLIFCIAVVFSPSELTLSAKN